MTEIYIFFLTGPMYCTVKLHCPLTSEVEDLRFGIPRAGTNGSIVLQYNEKGQ